MLRSPLRCARGLVVLAILGLALERPLSAQDQQGGAWFAFAGAGSFDYPRRASPWRWWLDVHARFFERSAFDTSIVRPGVGYHLGGGSTLWAGYAWIRSDPRDVAAFDEHRIWQQYTWGEKSDVGSLFARTRLEQRFDDRGGEVGWRLRQFLRWTKYLPSTRSWSLRVWNEFFFDLNQTDWGQDPGLSQNRFFAGLGWQPDPDTNLVLEVGYLNQFLRREDGEDGMNHIIGTTLLWLR
ncbi:MAG: DUF2490 domain-containing protein [Planctomycetota bacterium]